MQCPRAREWCITAAASQTCLCQTAAKRQQQQTNQAWFARHCKFRGRATSLILQLPSSITTLKLIRCCTPLPTAAVPPHWSPSTIETLKVWHAANCPPTLTQGSCECVQASSALFLHVQASAPCTTLHHILCSMFDVCFCVASFMQRGSCIGFLA